AFRHRRPATFVPISLAYLAIVFTPAFAAAQHCQSIHPLIWIQSSHTRYLFGLRSRFLQHNPCHFSPTVCNTHLAPSGFTDVKPSSDQHRRLG
ncbi:hypothetical protein P171DRAFT_380314, partial [Karstenula rhodostoma CBS 690.94]